MADGTMSAPFALTDGDFATPEVAFNGEVFLVVWSVPGPRETRGAIVGLDGAIRKLLDLGQGGLHRPEVTTLGEDFYVAAYQWQTQEVALTKVASDGSIVSNEVIISEPTSNFAIGTHRGDVVVAWNPGHPSVTSPIKVLAGNEPFVFGEGWLRTIVSDPDGAMIVLAIDNEYARRIGGSETYLLPQTLPSAVLDGASNGSDVVLVAAIPGHDGDLVLESVGYGEVELLTRAPRHQMLPEIADAGEMSLVTWSERNAAQPGATLRAARVGPEGASEPLTIPIAGPYLDRAVASNGTDWLLVWVEGQELVGARVTRNGELLPKFVIARNPLGTETVVAWDGSAYVVVFLRGIMGRGSYISTVFATHVSPDGAVGPEVQVSNPSSIESPAVAASPNAAVIAWFDYGTTRAALLSRAGAVTPLFAITGTEAIAPAVAWNGSTFVVAVRQRNIIRWLRVSETGVVTEAPDTAVIHAPSFGSIHLEPVGSRFLLLAQGHAAILDPRGFAGELVPIAPDPNARLSGTSVAYVRPVEAAWQNITRVFVKRLTLQGGPPRRRSAR